MAPHWKSSLKINTKEKVQQYLIDNTSNDSEVNFLFKFVQNQAQNHMDYFIN